jgi:hypothetical protein
MANKKKERKLKREAEHVKIAHEKKLELRKAAREAALNYLTKEDGAVLRRRERLLRERMHGPVKIPDMPEGEDVALLPWGYFTFLKYVNEFVDEGTSCDVEFEFDEHHNAKIILYNDASKRDFMNLVKVSESETKLREAKLVN